MKKRVLIVDDALLMRMMLRDVLEGADFEVVGEAEEADEAVAKYKEFKPDLVTMDLTLTSSDGTDAIQDILAYDPEANIIVISAVDQRKVLMQAITMGVKDFIVKPFENERLLAAVSKVMG